MAAGMALMLASVAFNAPRLPPSHAVLHRSTTAMTRTAMPSMIEIDSNVLIGVGTLVASVGGGIALIAFTENAGKANVERANAQVCVKCKAEKVTTCTICQGTGEDSLAQYVAAVREEAGEQGGTITASTVQVDDWEGGPRQVEMYAEILSAYPVKVTTNICTSCDGRGVIVCDNCEGSGIQPRFLERYSPDDFMD